METLLIDEEFVSQFKFWMAGQLQTGIEFRGGLFRCASRFHKYQRDQAFNLAETLVQQGQEVIVTSAPSQYIVWVNLRSPQPLALKSTPNFGVA